MFSKFERPRGNVFMAPVNSILGSVFLGTCALWAGLFMWTISTGSDPLTRAFTQALESRLTLQE